MAEPKQPAEEKFEFPVSVAIDVTDAVLLQMQKRGVLSQKEMSAVRSIAEGGVYEHMDSTVGRFSANVKAYAREHPNKPITLDDVERLTYVNTDVFQAVVDHIKKSHTLDPRYINVRSIAARLRENDFVGMATKEAQERKDCTSRDMELLQQAGKNLAAQAAQPPRADLVEHANLAQNFPLGQGCIVEAPVVAGSQSEDKQRKR